MMRLAVLLFIAGIRAAPLTARQSTTDQSIITNLTTAEVAAFRPYTFFSSAAYCQPSTTLTWTCGANCDGNPGFEPIASGGDGTTVQFWYVGFDPTTQEVIVAHQGTDPEKIEADATDIDFPRAPLNSTLFPGIDSSIEAHSGFANDQASTADSVLAAVTQAMAAHSATKVTMVGHSLGAAISLLDSVFLPLHLPTTTTFKTVVYGLPRVGNQEFADYVDANVKTLTHITNKKDPVPTVPGQFLGFVQPAGEVHIQDSGVFGACPGQDNESDLCSTGEVPTVLEGDVGDHDGPYDGVTMGC